MFLASAEVVIDLQMMNHVGHSACTTEAVRPVIHVIVWVLWACAQGADVPGTQSREGLAKWAALCRPHVPCHDS